MKINSGFLLPATLAISACGGSNSNQDGNKDTSIVIDSNILLMDTTNNDTGIMDTSVIDTAFPPVPKP